MPLRYLTGEREFELTDTSLPSPVFEQDAK
jgi:hypothetical protein